MNTTIKSVINKDVANVCGKLLCRKLRSLIVIVESASIIVLLLLLYKKMLNANVATRIVLICILLAAIAFETIIFTISYKRNCKIASKRMMDQINTTNHSESVEHMVDFNDEHAIIHKDSGDMDLYMKDLRSFCETDNYICLVYNGMVLLVFDKKDITVGVEEFKKYLGRFANQKKGLYA